MQYRVHPNSAWVHDPNTDTTHVMALPGGEPLSLGGTGCTIFLDVVEGRDPLAAATERWNTEDPQEVQQGVQQFLDSLVKLNILVADPDARATAARATTPSRATTAAESDEAPATPRRPGRSSYELLFVCTANMSRSAYADITMRRLDIPGLDVRSAGTHAQVGRKMDPVMIKQLPDPSWANDHVVEPLTRDVAETADLIVAMSERHRDFILDEWPNLAKRTFLIGHVAREIDNVPATARPEDVAPFLYEHRTVERGDSVRDPYGRGDEASREAARRIDACLEPLARVLARVLMGGQA